MNDKNEFRECPDPGDAITHGVECPSCGRETYEWERYCHRCGADRWSA